MGLSRREKAQIPFMRNPKWGYEFCSLVLWIFHLYCQFLCVRAVYVMWKSKWNRNTAFTQNHATLSMKSKEAHLSWVKTVLPLKGSCPPTPPTGLLPPCYQWAVGILMTANICVLFFLFSFCERLFFCTFTLGSLATSEISFYYAYAHFHPIKSALLW